MYKLDRDAPKERLKAPARFQDRLTRVGGLNRYGEPNFKLSWAQTETRIQGGEWQAAGETFTGYKEVLLGDGLPHWMLLQWTPPGMSIDMPFLPPEPPSLFYHNNRCPMSGLCLLGEYPYKGSYQVVMNLLAKEFREGQLYVEAYPLSDDLITVMIPMIQAAMEVSIQAKMKFIKEKDAEEEQKLKLLYEDAYADGVRKAALASTKWLEDKQRAMERNFHLAAKQVDALHRNRRIQTDRPIAG